MNIVKLFNLYGSTFIKENRLNLILFILITVFYFTIEVVGISYIVNQGFNNPNYLIIIYSAFILVFMCLLNYLKGIFENRIGCESRKHSRIKLFTSIIDRFKLSYQDIRVGDILNRIVCSTLEFSFAINAFTKGILPRILIMLICSVTILIFTSVQIGFILLLGIFVLVIVSYFNLSRISPQKKIIEDAFAVDFDNYTNQFNNLLQSYLNNQHEQEKKKITLSQQIYSEKQFIAEKTLNDNTTILKAILSFFILVILVYIYYFSKQLKKDSVIFLGLIIVFYISAALSYSTESSEFFGHLGVCQSSYDKFMNLLKKKTENSSLNIDSGDINISNLKFQYQGHQPILENINLYIPNKKKVAIMGRSGSGKSTLAKLILKLGNYQGSIKVGNVDIQNVDSTHLRQKAVYINQRTELKEDTVLENIKYGSTLTSPEIVSFLNKYQLIEVFSGLNNGKVFN